MKALVATLALLLSTQAASAATAPKADNGLTTMITCSFTEPFFTLNIDLVKRQVTHTEYDWDNKDPKSDYITKVIARQIRVQADMSDAFLPKYKVLDRWGRVIAEMALNMAGTDSMSDVTFPFDIKHKQYFGGCYSNKIAAVEPVEY